MANFFKSNKYACITSLAVLVIMILTLFVFRIGVADNGDLTSRLVSMGLYDAQGVSGTGYYSTQFGVADKTFSFMPSDIVYSAFKMVFPIDTAIPTFLPALIYMIFAVWGVYMIVKALTSDSKWNNLALCAATILIGAETSYVAFFNTPYQLGAAISYFIPMIGALLMNIKYEKTGYALVFGLFGVLFAGTMPQAGVVGVFIALFALYLAFKQTLKINKVICALECLLILCGSYVGVIQHTDANKYNTVFYGIASESNTNAPAVLKELGIEGKDDLIGKDLYTKEAQEFIASPEFSEVMKNVNPVKIATLYAKNTDMMKANFEKTCLNSMFIRVDYLGYYPQSSGKAYQPATFFTIYNNVKKAIVPANYVILAVIFLAIIIFALDYKKKFAQSNATKNACVLTVFLTLAAVISLIIPVIYFGEAQISFNLLIYNLVFDSLVFASIVGGTKLLTSRRNALREKFGVNQ